MARFRNDGDADHRWFGYDFAAGPGVTTVPDDIDPDKLAFLRRNLTEVVEAEQMDAEDDEITLPMEYVKYEDLKITELREVCRERGISPWNKTKAELIAELEDWDDGKER